MAEGAYKSGGTSVSQRTARFARLVTARARRLGGNPRTALKEAGFLDSKGRLVRDSRKNLPRLTPSQKGKATVARRKATGTRAKTARGVTKAIIRTARGR